MTVNFDNQSLKFGPKSLKRTTTPEMSTSSQTDAKRIRFPGESEAEASSQPASNPTRTEQTLNNAIHGIKLFQLKLLMPFFMRGRFTRIRDKLSFGDRNFLSRGKFDDLFLNLKKCHPEREMYRSLQAKHSSTMIR